jgi:hypothetical protein
MLLNKIPGLNLARVSMSPSGNLLYHSHSILARIKNLETRYLLRRLEKPPAGYVH